VPVNGPEPTSGRETRLLVLVVVVSLAVLLLLARFRFPTANLATVNPSPGPLAGMAARATFEEMSTTLADILTRAGATLDVIRLEPAPRETPAATDAGRGTRDTPPAAGASGGAPPAEAGVTPRFVPLLRVRKDLGLLHVPLGWRPAGIRDMPNAIEVVWIDTEREIAAVRLPPVPGSFGGLPASAAGVTGFLYVGVIQGTRSGPTIQPAFIGRTDTETDARWSAPLVVVSGASAVPLGSLVYAIDGRLVGLVTRHDAGVAIVPASALDEAVTRLSAGAPQE
jgi:hypothetical protein